MTPIHQKIGTFIPFSILKFNKNRRTEHRCSVQTTVQKDFKMKIRIVAFSIIYLSTGQLYAAAIDRSGQSILPFLQKGNYFEAGYSVLDPNVSGKIKPDFSKGGLTTAANMETGDIANSYAFPSAALKFQLTDHFSIGFLYDHPFGADAGYPIKDYPAYTQGTEKSESEVVTQSLSTILGYQPNEHFNVYAGPVLQTTKGNSRLRGAGYNWIKYDMNAPETDGVGWLAGFAYSIPEIALQAAVTYRSEIDHDIDMTESVQILNPTNPALGYVNLGTTTLESTVTTPQSVNIDLQSGIMQDTVAFANFRWVEWSKFRISPERLAQLTTQLTGKAVDLAAYSDDQYAANIGIGRKFNTHWSGSVSLGWDSGAGNPVTTLGPTEGYWSIGLGAKYAPAPNYDISLGLKYFMLGDAKAQSGFDFGTDNYDAIYKDNDAWGYGLKIGYRF